MKLLFLSDTHWNLPFLINQINISDIDLIVLLWDNTIEDLNILKNIDIPRIGVIGNHRFRWSDGNLWTLEEFGIEDISFRLFEFGKVKFCWIDGNLSYQLAEDIREKRNPFKIFNPKTHDEILKFEKLEKDLFEIEKLDFLISHFPARWIMDKPNFSHRWLNLIKSYIETKNPKYFMHGHLHNPQTKQLWNTEIIQVFEYLIFEM